MHNNPPPSPGDEFDDEYLCPYCAEPTDPQDRRCGVCGGELWSKTRRRERHSSALWSALVLQTSITIYLAIVFSLMLVYAAYKAEIADPFALLPVYLGLPGSIPPRLADNALAAVPRLYIIIAALAVLFFLGILVGLYLRWRPASFLFVSSAVVILFLAVAGSIPLGQRIGSALETRYSGLIDFALLGQRLGLTFLVSGVALALLMFWLWLRMDEDFSFDEQRILLNLDRGATNSLTLLDSGNRYLKRGMWAKAALHLKRAATGMPERIGCRLSLAVAYANLKRYDLAAEALEQAGRINPADPRVAELAALLDSLRSQSAAQPPSPQVERGAGG